MPLKARSLHLGADLTFDERLGEHGEEVAEQERFDAVRGLQVDRRDFLGASL